MTAVLAPASRPLVPDELVDAVASSMPSRAGIQLHWIARPRLVNDASDKFFVRDAEGRPKAVVDWSSTVNPSSAANEATRAREVSEAMGSELARAIVVPVLLGMFEGRTCSIAPYHAPLSTWRVLRRWQRMRIVDQFLPWWQGVAFATAREVDAERVDRHFRQPLQIMASHTALASDVKHAASAAITALNDGAWTPRVTVAHYDLWLGNLLRGAPRSPLRFGIIDWGGGRVEGHGIFDLLRFGDSVGLPRHRLRAEVISHCLPLGCEPSSARHHALAGLGHLAANLGAWPVEDFARVASIVLRQLHSIEL